MKIDSGYFYFIVSKNYYCNKMTRINIEFSEIERKQVCPCNSQINDENFVNLNPINILLHSLDQLNKTE